MKVKMNRNAAKFFTKLLESDEAQGKMVRVYVTENHVNHAHFDWKLDTPTEHDEIVKTDKDINILLDTREEFLDGVWIQYFFLPKEEFLITNPSTGFHQH